MADNTQPKAVIHLSRNSPKDIAMRGLEIFIDGKFAANVEYGRTVDIPVEPGEHTLKATNNLYTRKDDFVIASGETRNYEVANVASGIFSLMIAMGGIGPYKVVLKQV